MEHIVNISFIAMILSGFLVLFLSIGPTTNDAGVEKFKKGMTIGSIVTCAVVIIVIVIVSKINIPAFP